MTTWQGIESTATQSPRSKVMLGLSAESKISGSSSSSKSAPGFPSILRPLALHAAAAWKWLERKRTQQLSARRLRIAETIQLGEKRFVSILQVDGSQFLIGGAAGSVSLLAVLNQDQCAAVKDVLAEAMQ